MMHYMDHNNRLHLHDFRHISCGLVCKHMSSSKFVSTSRNHDLKFPRDLIRKSNPNAMIKHSGITMWRGKQSSTKASECLVNFMSTAIGERIMND